MAWFEFKQWKLSGVHPLEGRTGGVEGKRERKREGGSERGSEGTKKAVWNGAIGGELARRGRDEAERGRGGGSVPDNRAKVNFNKLIDLDTGKEKSRNKITGITGRTNRGTRTTRTRTRIREATTRFTRAKNRTTGKNRGTRSFTLPKIDS